MKTPELIASRLVDGPNPDDRTLPLIDSEPIPQDEGACEGGYRDVLTLTRKAYRQLIAAAITEAVAERDADVERLRAENAALRERIDGNDGLRQQIVERCEQMVTRSGFLAKPQQARCGGCNRTRDEGHTSWCSHTGFMGPTGYVGPAVAPPCRPDPAWTCVDPGDVTAGQAATIDLEVGTPFDQP